MRGETPNVVPNAIARGLCAMALLCAAQPSASRAGSMPFRATNAYVEVESTSPVSRNGGLDFRITDATNRVSVRVSPLPGWQLLTPRRVDMASGLAGSWKVANVLGESGGGGEICIPSSSIEDRHAAAPTLDVGPVVVGGGPFIVADADEKVAVSPMCACRTVENGRHDEVEVRESCPGGKTNTRTETVVGSFETDFDTYALTWSIDGEEHPSGMSQGQNAASFSLGQGVHSVKAEVVASWSGCDRCRDEGTADTNVVVSLLSVGCDPWLGQDRRGDPAAPYESPSVTAMAALSPPNPEVRRVGWAYSGVCDQSESGAWTKRLWATDREAASAGHLGETVTASAGGKSVSTNFTVVKVDVVLDGLGEAAEEADGAYLAAVEDAPGAITPAGTSGMLAVSFSCTPGNLPPEEMVRISNLGPGELYLVEDGELHYANITNIPACDIGGKKFLLHGHAASAALKDGRIKITHPSSGAIDEAKYTVVLVDLDIDSDNNALDGVPARNPAEEALEDTAGHPGRALALNELDFDKDGVPDYADGYDSGYGEGAKSAFANCPAFIPLVLECGALPQDAAVTIEYSANESNPAAVPDLANISAQGKVRLWRKNGYEARLKAPAPAGDFIPSGHNIPLEEISGNTLTYYIEAVGGSASCGDVVFTLKVKSGQKEFSDTAKATVFRIDAVHPEAQDFAAGHVGRVMISTKQDDEYYTTALTTRANKAAQSEDHEVVATAYVLPIPLDGYNPPTVYFEVTDPDDLSPYEGAPGPGQPGNTNPDDNCDPQKRMEWNSGAPSGYDSYQVNALGKRDDKPQKMTIGGTMRYAAETQLHMTDRYSGDNYQIRATLQDSQCKPFDTLSGMTAPFDSNRTTSVKASEKLIAWKRVYIEQDEMYKHGCTLTAAFTPDADGTGVMQVDSVDDFPILPTNAIAFWVGGSANVRILSKATKALRVSGINVHVPQYGGIRFPGDEETYTVDRRFLPNAYGSSPDGTDGGAFIEFKMIQNNPNARTPKYKCFPNSYAAIPYFRYWFDNIMFGRANTFMMAICAKCLHDNNETYGLTFTADSICSIYFETANNLIQLNDSVAHEVGHRFSLLNVNMGGFSAHVDNEGNYIHDHSKKDYCLMSYDRNRFDTIVEFCIQCLFEGPFLFQNECLRRRLDE